MKSLVKILGGTVLLQRDVLKLHCCSCYSTYIALNWQSMCYI
uniref:Uncharacterized protein n=1 Tax=Anguilla anguilla TaxID=7936 RepID=A0A0E9WIN7_ANGAN